MCTVLAGKRSNLVRLIFNGGMASIRGSGTQVRFRTLMATGNFSDGGVHHIGLARDFNAFGYLGLVLFRDRNFNAVHHRLRHTLAAVKVRIEKRMRFMGAMAFQ